MKILVARFDPDKEKNWVQEYEIDTAGRSMTAMDVLQKISDEQDPTLGYYRHSICNHGICARCSMEINGKVRLACTEIVSGLESVTIAPVPKKQIVRDLVTNEMKGRENT